MNFDLHMFGKDTLISMMYDLQSQMLDDQQIQSDLRSQNYNLREQVYGFQETIRSMEQRIKEMSAQRDELCNMSSSGDWRRPTPLRLVWTTENEKLTAAVVIPAIKGLRAWCDKNYQIYPGLKDTKDFVEGKTTWYIGEFTGIDLQEGGILMQLQELGFQFTPST
jgi:hypothetical protein